MPDGNFPVRSLLFTGQKTERLIIMYIFARINGYTTILYGYHGKYVTVFTNRQNRTKHYYKESELKRIDKVKALRDVLATYRRNESFIATIKDRDCVAGRENEKIRHIIDNLHENKVIPTNNIDELRQYVEALRQYVDELRQRLNT